MGDNRLSEEQERFVEQVRHHLEQDGSSGIDPLVEEVQDECPTCGAYVLNQALHKAWHEDTDRRFRLIDAEARRYKPEPRYG